LCRRATFDFIGPLISCSFRPPWSVEEQAACFVVRDHNGQALAYVCFEGGASSER
jgi:hypothetical protein